MASPCARKHVFLWASLGAASLGSGAALAKARVLKPTSEPTRGAWGWTSGEETYLRVRPSKSDPVVAKVPHSTKMFVWGKYNGWYRVETVDHKFGWVYHDFLNCPKAAKIAPLTHAKASSASDRASAQTLYGSKATLQNYYARHGSSGAVRGLAKQGVRIASAPKPHAAKPAAHKPAAPKPATPKLAAQKPATPKPMAPKLVAVPKPAQAKPAPKLVAAPAPKLVPRARVAQGLPVARPESVVPRAASLATEAAAASEPQAVPQVLAPHADEAITLPDQAAPSAAAPSQAVLLGDAAASARRPAPRPVAAKPVAKPAAKPVAKVPVAKPAVAKPAAKPRMTAAQARARAQQQRQAWLLKQRQERYNRRLAARGATRDKLRARFGAAKLAGKGVPPLAVKPTRPISPEELMRARESHLTKSLPPAPVRDVPPASFPTATDDFKRRMPVHQSAESASEPESDLSPRADASSEGVGARFQFASYTPCGEDETGFSLASHTSRGRSVAHQPDAPEGSRWATPQDGPDAAAFDTGSSPSAAELAAIQGAAHGADAPCAPLPSRAGSPRDRMPAPKAARSGFKAGVVASRGQVVAARGVRGGSPRDYYAAQRRASGAAFGQGLASGALSYRGTPYRSGGTSPRGFDCSGLVYFLLRQRGITPPRTAAGLASFGKPVGKKSLQAGDIVLFSNTYKRGISHVGIYQGEGKFVHAPHTGARVRTDLLFSGYYNAKYWGARRPK